MQEANKELLERVEVACDTFNPTTATKKEIVGLRKVLGELKNAKYPKAKKVKKPTKKQVKKD